ncbi:hypothetical protein C8N43_3457 [Litoreibacter ponti]|uniref:Uncharacterized protein n=1 Tax=Litoreibacter ponti TaxID=1510457 RepID=A0A2T6BF11_9RHOB|nr:hypothetical protein [Litoreibacter ponti]PTX54640.1 hypothetical protein C8N43_3457 [Litoreibacter ponti]
MKRISLTAAALAISASTAFAGSTFDMSATLNGTTERQMTVMSEGHMAGLLISQYAPVEGAAGNPMNGMTGSCTGHMVIAAPAASGGGLCDFNNAAGDKMVISYEVIGLNRDGGISGSWTAHGGAGKTACVQGGGSFVNSAITDAGTFEQKVTGAITLP